MDVIKKQRYSSQSSHLQSLGVSSCSPLAMKGLRVSEKERRENTRNQRASTKVFFSCKLQMVQQLHLRASQAYLYVENALFFCYGTNKYTGNKAPDLREPQYIQEPEWPPWSFCLRFWSSSPRAAVLCRNTSGEGSDAQRLKLSHSPGAADS